MQGEEDHAGFEESELRVSCFRENVGGLRADSLLIAGVDFELGLGQVDAAEAARGAARRAELMLAGCPELGGTHDLIWNGIRLLRATSWTRRDHCICPSGERARRESHERVCSASNTARSCSLSALVHRHRNDRIKEQADRQRYGRGPVAFNVAHLVGFSLVILLRTLLPSRSTLSKQRTLACE